MNIRIASLTEGQNRWAENVASFDVGMDQHIFPHELSVELDVQKTSSRINVYLTVHTLGHFECDRCGVDIEQRVGGTISVSFVQRPEPFDNEMPGDDLRSFRYGQDVVDISCEVRDAVVLSIPMKILCKEDCKGFCLKCNTNLNLETCGCN